MPSKRTKLPLAFCLIAILVLAAVYLPFRLSASTADEVDRLAVLMDWKPVSVVADIGAGDGRYAFAAAAHVGGQGKVFATEIDQEKLTSLHEDVQKRHLQNVVIIESKDADTSLPDACCDAIFLRRVYHHLTKPAE